MNLFAWASISEKGTVNGAKGDQKQGGLDSKGNDVKGEVKVGGYYQFKQTMVIRFKNKTYGRKAAEAAKLFANSKLVGYGQNDRYDLYNACSALGWNLSKIKKAMKNGTFPKCNCDCSSFCATAINVGVGKKLVECFTTSTAESKTVDRYPKFFEKKYVHEAEKSWRKGDMPNAPGHHIIMNV